MFLDQVIGYDNIKLVLLNLLENKKIGHAYLFISPEGGGGLALALNFANYLICLPEKNDNFDISHIESSNSFKRAQKYLHPDIHFVFPTIKFTDKKKYLCQNFMEQWRSFLNENIYATYFEWLQYIEAENKQGKITKEDCDILIENLHLKPYEADYKVCIIWKPEFLKTEGNRLLKLIEEPPPNTVFILVTDQEEDVLPTIQSRCQKIHLPKYSTIEVEQGLINYFKTEPLLAKRLSIFSQGDLNLALNYLKHPFSEELVLLKKWLNAIYKNLQIDLQKIIDEINKTGREKQKHLITYLLWLIDLSIQQNIKPKEELFFTDEEENFVKSINNLINNEHKVFWVDYLNKTYFYIERNANSKIMFMTLSIQLYYLLKKKEFISV
ncbi:MAG: hypothetical protein ORN85_09145 [Sediminibacterium sp.]|nr:hypothetical protein [Sediminibacterium sp.]